MRVSRQKFAENREKILTAASVLFRENGFDGVGVADIMKAAGLTHGGFYGHFESKDDLALEVSRKLIERVEERWREQIASQPERPLQALLDHYIHWRTVDDPGGSCVFASLTQEVSRSEGAVHTTQCCIAGGAATAGDGGDSLVSGSEIVAEDGSAYQRLSA